MKISQRIREIARPMVLATSLMIPSTADAQPAPNGLFNRQNTQPQSLPSSAPSNPFIWRSRVGNSRYNEALKRPMVPAPGKISRTLSPYPSSKPNPPVGSSLGLGKQDPVPALTNEAPYVMMQPGDRAKLNQYTEQISKINILKSKLPDEVKRERLSRALALTFLEYKVSDEKDLDITKFKAILNRHLDDNGFSAVIDDGLVRAYFRLRNGLED